MLHSRIGCSETRLAENMGAPHMHRSTRRNRSAGSRHGTASRLHAEGGDPRISARTGAIRTQYDGHTSPELGLRDAESATVLDTTGASDIPDGTVQHDQTNAVGSVRPDGYPSVHWAASSEPAAKSAAEPASAVQHSRQEDEAEQRRRKASLRMEAGR
jgi:hypothetical protein